MSEFFDQNRDVRIPIAHGALQFFRSCKHLSKSDISRNALHRVDDSLGKFAVPVLHCGQDLRIRVRFLGGELHKQVAVQSLVPSYALQAACNVNSINIGERTLRRLASEVCRRFR